MNSMLGEIELKNSDHKQTKHQCVPPETFPILTNIIEYNDFFRQFLEKNTPCLIRNKSLMENWQSCADWIDSYEQTINLDYFKRIIDIHQHHVPVSNCGKKYFNSQEKSDMSFNSFSKHWSEMGKNSDCDLYYLKDWHFVKEVPNYKAYETPFYFFSDWLNEYLEDSGQEINPSEGFQSSDYKFVYIGPKDSWTPFHSDVFGSYSWSANVIGEKEWIFFPPGNEKFLIDKCSGEVLYDVYNVLPCNQTELFNRQSFTYEGREIVYYKIRQRQNEIVFVPSEWYHQVKNIESTISINHNWFNATNVMTIWNILRDELKKVESEILDCKATCEDAREWNDMCQNLLRSSHGMNVKDFVHLCTYIAEKRISSLTNFDYDKYEGHRFGLKHIIYDINILKQVFDQIENENFLPEESSKLVISINNTLSDNSKS